MARDAFVLIVCSICNTSQSELDLDHVTADTWEGKDVDAVLRALGWHVDLGVDICPTCAGEDDINF